LLTVISKSIGRDIIHREDNIIINVNLIY